MLKNRHNGAVRNEAEAKEHEIVDDECASHVRHVGHLDRVAIGEILLDTNSDVLYQRPQVYGFVPRPQLQLELSTREAVA